MWFDKRYHSLDYEMKSRYGHKIYRIALDGGFTCPNRDGRCGYNGCIFCSSGGSGDFASHDSLSISQQIEEGKKLLKDKQKDPHYIAYFQAFTGTYAPVEKLRQLFSEAISHPEIDILSVATRPDCLPEEVLDLLEELNQIKPVWIELGLQSMHEETARYIRRGYELPVFEQAVKNLSERNIETIVHVILGLPGETSEDMLATARYIARLPISGVKFQLLHILKGTDLLKDYEDHLFEAMTEEEYIDILIRCIEVIPPSMVVHRITGDGPKKILVAPLWSGNKKKVLNDINHTFKIKQTWQGKYFQQLQ